MKAKTANEASRAGYICVAIVIKQITFAYFFLE